MDAATEILAGKRDALIVLLDGAVKFQPMLDAMAAEERAKLPLDLVVGKSASEIDAIAAANVDQEKALALAQEEHAKFIAQLREELRTDPEKRGYAGRSVEEIADEMMIEREVKEDRPAPSLMSGIVNDVLGALIVRPDNLAIDANGRILNEGYADLQAAIDAKVAKSGQAAEALAAAGVEAVVVGMQPAPCWRVIRGVKYGRNAVRVKEIEEALR